MNRAGVSQNIGLKSDIRSISSLNKRGSTARVLNLIRIHQEADLEGERITTPLFKNDALNACFFIKHNLLDNEKYIFPESRTRATKILIPFNVKELNLGGQYVFLGQPGYLEALSHYVGGDLGAASEDARTLHALDSMPSFDPFLLRQWLARNGILPDMRYFDLNMNDVKEIELFVQGEILKFLSMASRGAAGGESASRLVKKMMSGKDDHDLEPFRHTLKFGKTEFQEGLFAWRGFLYYKWCAAAMEAVIPKLVEEMASARPERDWGPDARKAVNQCLVQLTHLLVKSYAEAKRRLSAYDQTFEALTVQRNPYPFREFLLTGPTRFQRLGELMGSLQNLMQFWNYRTQGRNPARIRPEEYFELWFDFEGSFKSQDIS